MPARWSPEGLPPDGAFRYPRRMLKLLAHHLLTTGITTLLGMAAVTFYLNGTQQGLHELPAMTAGVLFGTVLVALVQYRVRKRRLRHP